MLRGPDNLIYDIKPEDGLQDSLLFFFLPFHAVIPLLSPSLRLPPPLLIPHHLFLPVSSVTSRPSLHQHQCEQIPAEKYTSACLHASPAL